MKKTSTSENKRELKLIIATGISGCGRKEYFKKWEDFCRLLNKKVKVFPVGELMLKHAESVGFKINKENILNADPDTLHILRSAVLNRILAEIENGKYAGYQALVLSVHGFFYWNDCFIKAYDKFLNNFSPDMFVACVDDFRNISSRLGSRKQWSAENLSAIEILHWQNAEVELTSILAGAKEKPFFVIPTPLSQESVSTFYKLVFNQEIEPVYVSMPISHLKDPKARKNINRFIKKLHSYFTVFDPLSIETVGAIDINKEKKITKSYSTIYNQITHRDLYWLLGNSSKIIVYWPKSVPPQALQSNKKIARLWPKAVPSPGVDHETHEAFEKTKDVWVVFLGKEASPFVTHAKTKMFYSENEFFKFLAKTYPEINK